MTREEMRDRAWRHWQYLAETSITEDYEFYEDDKPDKCGYYSWGELAPSEEDTMTHEEMMNRAWQFTEEISWLITDDKAAFQEDPTHLVLVDDIDKVRDAYYDDLVNGFEDEDEDIYQFLDRHGIEWQ